MHLRQGSIGDEYTPSRLAARQFIFPPTLPQRGLTTATASLTPPAARAAKKKGSPEGVRAPCLLRGKEQVPVAILGRDVEQRAVGVNAGRRCLTVPIVHKAF